MAIVIIIRVVELHKHKVYQMAIKRRLSNCHVFLASCFLQLQFVVEVEGKTTFFPLFIC